MDRKANGCSIQALVNRTVSTSAQNSLFEYAMMADHRTDRGLYR